MEKITLLLCSFSSAFLFSQTVFINEIHYDNQSTDVNEGIEIAGLAGTDLSFYSIELYRDVGTVYDTENLTGVIPDQQSGLGTLFFPISGIQNGPADGLALIENGTVIQFLSYEGTLIATEGSANGMTSVDIGVSESGTTLDTESLQLSGTGSVYTDFTWQAPAAATQGSINNSQVFEQSTLSNPQLELLKSTAEIFPNPSLNGKVTFVSDLPKVEASVYTSIGTLVSQKTIEGSGYITSENLTTGIYFVQLSTYSGSVTKKLIVQ